MRRAIRSGSGWRRRTLRSFDGAVCFAALAVAFALPAISAEAQEPVTTASTPGMPSVPSTPVAPLPNAVVEQPRAFGYVIGDVLTQRVLLRLDGREFVPAELPTAGRAGVWFERRAVRTEMDVQGRHWLAIDYQLMNSPQALAVATLPAWKLVSKGASGSGSSSTSVGAANAELRIGAWPMTVGPLTPEQPFPRTGLGVIRPDRSAVPIPLAPIQNRLTLGFAALVVLLAGWLGWLAWRNWRASASQPFASALREMRNLDDSAPETWHALHRAFDGTAGRAVRAETLGALFDRAPQLAPLRATIEQFFSQSAARFFAGQQPATPVAVHALCRDLRRIEKRHEP